VKQPHAGLDALFADERDVVDDDEEVVENLRDCAPTGHTVGDGLDGVGLHDRAATPRQRHGRRSHGLDGDHLDVWGEGSRDMTDAACQRAAAERDHQVKARLSDTTGP
jgi:hypothetical protein